MIEGVNVGDDDGRLLQLQGWLELNFGPANEDVLWSKVNPDDFWPEEQQDIVLEKMFDLLLDPDNHDDYHIFCGNMDILDAIKGSFLSTKKRYISIKELKQVLLEFKIRGKSNPYFTQYLKDDKKNVLIHCILNDLTKNKIIEKKNGKYLKMNKKIDKNAGIPPPRQPFEGTIYLCKTSGRTNFGESMYLCVFDLYYVIC